MKFQIPGKLLIIIAIASLLCLLALSKPTIEELDTKHNTHYTPSGLTCCSGQIDPNAAIKILSAGNWTEAEQTRKQLLDYANSSVDRRNETVQALIRSMTKPNLNFISDKSSYFLWLHGSIVLGELKAVEALDLLIDHLDLNDGSFSASMAHQPAILGITAMGVVAVPKLKVALQHNANRNIRLAAALCLNEIDGQDAMKALSQSLASESDPCVSRFIQIAIEISNSKVNANVSPAKQSESDKRVKLIQELLMAFKCDN